MVERKKGFQFFAHCIMILITLFCLLPFLLLIVSSFTDEATLIRDGYSFFPQKLSLNAYRYLLVDSTAIVRGYLISITVTAIGTIANLLITVMFAYPLSRRFAHAEFLCVFSFLYHAVQWWVGTDVHDVDPDVPHQEHAVCAFNPRAADERV